MEVRISLEALSLPAKATLINFLLAPDMPMIITRFDVYGDPERRAQVRCLCVAMSNPSHEKCVMAEKDTRRAKMVPQTRVSSVTVSSCICGTFTVQ